MASGPRYSRRERLLLSTCVEDWNVGVVPQTADDIVARGLRQPIRWLPAPPRHQFLADPSCRERDDGTLVLYAECFDRNTGLGEIWSAEVGRGEDPALARFRPLLAEAFHLSYPFPFRGEQGQPMLTAESWTARATLLWRDADGRLDRTGTLFADKSIVDPTLWQAADRWWLFCTLEDDDANANLYAFHTRRIGDPWVPHRANPIKSNRRGGRPAGPLFHADGALIRPGQDCTETYGGAVILHAVRRLDPEHFEEEEIRRLAPQRPYGSGLHTICPAGDVTLIDGRRWRPTLGAVRATVSRKAASLWRRASQSS